MKRSLLITILLFTASASADPVYRTVDKNGVTVYSNKPKEAGAKPVQLPSIIKQKFEGKEPDNITCIGHGGVNCDLGADSDGSVICYDGFRNSLQRFKLSCSAAKLSIIPQTVVVEGKKVKLVVRNNSAVSAREVKVTGPEALIFEGPIELEPLSSGEYEASPAPRKLLGFQVTCENCP